MESCWVYDPDLVPIPIPQFHFVTARLIDSLCGPGDDTPYHFIGQPTNQGDVFKCDCTVCDFIISRPLCHRSLIRIESRKIHFPAFFTLNPHRIRVQDNSWQHETHLSKRDIVYNGRFIGKQRELDVDEVRKRKTVKRHFSLLLLLYRLTLFFVYKLYFPFYPPLNSPIQCSLCRESSMGMRRIYRCWRRTQGSAIQ